MYCNIVFHEDVEIDVKAITDYIESCEFPLGSTFEVQGNGIVFGNTREAKLFLRQSKTFVKCLNSKCIKVKKIIPDDVETSCKKLQRIVIREINTSYFKSSEVKVYLRTTPFYTISFTNPLKLKCILEPDEKCTQFHINMF